VIYNRPALKNLCK